MEDDKITDLLLKVTGVSFPNLDGSSRQEILGNMSDNASISLVREPENEYDPNAIMVMADKKQVGYVSKEENIMIAPLMDSGALFEAEVWEKSQYKGTWYLHIIIREV
jgi:hypothetical protein